jgi:hypothetical protein
MSRSTRRLAAAVLAAAALAAACSNSGDDGESTTATTAATDATGTTAAGGGDSQRDTFVPITGVPGVTDDSIGFAVIGTKNGNPLGTCILDCYLSGIEAYFAFRNSEGGIYGRDLVVSQQLDDELANNQQRSLDVISGNDAFGVFDATLVPSGFADLDSNGVPTYTWGIHAEASGKPSVFPSIAPLCSDCIRRAVPYAVQQSGGTRVASLGYGVSENSKVCAQTTSNAIDFYSADIGAEMAYLNNDLAFGLPNGIAPEVTAMKEAGVDFIATCLDLNGVKKLAQELDRQGMGDVTVYHPNTYNQQFVAEADPLFEGDVIGVQFTPFEADPASAGAGLADFQQWMGETGADPTELAMVGWINAAAAFEGLLAAGPEFDRASVIAATNAITDFDADGLIQPIDWSRQHTAPTNDDRANDYPQECTALVRVVDGQFETMGPADRPWLCWSNDSTDFSEPVPTSFG